MAYQMAVLGILGSVMVHHEPAMVYQMPVLGILGLAMV